MEAEEKGLGLRGLEHWTGTQDTWDSILGLLTGLLGHLSEVISPPCASASPSVKWGAHNAALLCKAL